jgi:hypothetical protein
MSKYRVEIDDTYVILPSIKDVAEYVIERESDFSDGSTMYIWEIFPFEESETK